MEPGRDRHAQDSEPPLLMLPPDLHFSGKISHTPPCTGQKTLLSRPCRGALMARAIVSRPAAAPTKKKKKCPFFASRKAGKWTTMVCTLPADATCPDPRCQANPDSPEPDPHAGD